MPRFLVSWEIDVDGVKTPQEAAESAWRTMREQGSTSNVFTVTDETGEAHIIDLEEENDDE